MRRPRASLLLHQRACTTSCSSTIAERRDPAALTPTAGEEDFGPSALRIGHRSQLDTAQTPTRHQQWHRSRYQRRHQQRWRSYSPMPATRLPKSPRPLGLVLLGAYPPELVQYVRPRIDALLMEKLHVLIAQPAAGVARPRSVTRRSLPPSLAARLWLPCPSPARSGPWSC